MQSKLDDTEVIAIKLYPIKWTVKKFRNPCCGHGKIANSCLSTFKGINLNQAFYGGNIYES